MFQASDWEEIQGIAVAQHEIVILLIEKGEFHKVLDAASEIFQLDFPKNEEHRLVSETEILTDVLLRHDQIEIAHQIVTAAIKRVSTKKSKARLFQEQAYLFRKQGKPEEALRSFEKSKELTKEKVTESPPQ
jgi:tetratricopeptide (TPR) repeat protein